MEKTANKQKMHGGKITVWKPAEREEDPCMSVIRHRTMAIS